MKGREVDGPETRQNLDLNRFIRKSVIHKLEATLAAFFSLHPFASIRVNSRFSKSMDLEKRCAIPMAAMDF